MDGHSGGWPGPTWPALDRGEEIRRGTGSAQGAMKAAEAAANTALGGLSTHEHHHLARKLSGISRHQTPPVGSGGGATTGT